jgi:hypothetical protein
MTTSHTTDKCVNLRRFGSGKRDKPQWEIDANSKVDKLEWTLKIYNDARKTTNTSVKVQHGWDDLSKKKSSKQYGYTVTRSRGVIKKHAIHCKTQI